MTELPRLIDSNLRLHPLSLSISESITPVSTASMQLPKEENLPVRAFVELFTPLGSAGIYRVRSPEDAYGNDITSAELEHAIAEVGDYLVKTEISEMMSAGTAMQTIFSHYGGSRWQLGSTSALSGTIAVEAKYDRVLDAMLEILKQVPTCMMTFDFTTTPWTVGFVPKGTTVTAEGRLGRNVRSARVIYDDTELCTRVWYQIPSTDSSGQPTTTWTHMDADTLSTYGVIEREMASGSDYTVTEANSVALEYLRQHKNPRITVEIDAEELSNITGESLDTFTLGKLFRLALAEYNTTIEENITAISWADVYNSPDLASVRLGDEEDTVITFLHDVDAKGGSGGGGGAGKNTEELFKEYRTRIEQDDYHIALVSEHADHANNILQAAGIDINSQTGVVIYHEDIQNSVGARLTVNANAITAEVTRATENEGAISGALEVEAGKVAMVVGTNSGGNYIKAAEIATSINNAGQGVALISADHVNISSTSTAHLLSGSIKYDADGNLVLKESSGGGIVVERTSGQTTAQFGVFDNGNLTAGVIATKVNGVNSTYIYADKILMSSASGANSVAVEVNGKITANDVTANLIKSRIADIAIVEYNTLDGTSVYASSVSSQNIYFADAEGDPAGNLKNAITELQVVETSSGSGVYKIQKKDFGDSSWVDVTGNFSGAASVGFSSESLWSNGNKTLTLTNNKTHTVSIPTPSNYSGTYIGTVQDDPTMSVTVMVGGAAFNGQISASGAYNDGVTAGEGKFSPASPTLQGTQISGTVYHSVDSPNGVVYYTAGTKVKSTTLYEDAGSEYLYKASTNVTYYTNGTKAKKASGVTLTREYNWGTLYYWDNDRGDFLPLKNAYWYSSQYQLGATATAFEGSNVYVPDSNGSLYICAGSETLQKAINGAWYNKRSSSGTTCYVADNSGTTNLISSTSIRIAAVAAGYYGGSQVTNTYYTKTS